MFDVDARAKTGRRCAKNDATNRRIQICFGQNGRKTVEHLEAERVEPPRSVQRQDPNVFAISNENRIIVFASISFAVA
jgi:hypothetical protein